MGSKMKARIKAFLKLFRVHHLVVFAAILGIGIFNAVTALTPEINQFFLERNITKSFDQWWDEEGAAQIKAVGLEPDETIRQEKYEDYRTRYLKQQHSYIVEDRLEEMRHEFREWWEIKGGKQQWIDSHGNNYPNEQIFEQEWKEWSKKFKDKHIRYRLAFIPADDEYERLFTCWMLFPSFVGFLLFALLFGFAYVKLSDRWGAAIVLGCFILLAIGGGFIVSLFTGTSFFDHYAGERYMGLSIALAFFMGAMAFGPNQEEIPLWAKILAFVGFIADVATNWIINSGIYGAVSIASLLIFGLGIFAGVKIPTRRKTLEEVKAEAAAERMEKVTHSSPTDQKRKTRAIIDSGLREANQGQYEKALPLLNQGMTALLQEPTADIDAINSLAEKMTDKNMYIDIKNTQWTEWGKSAKMKKVYDAALLMLEKGLKGETSGTYARRCLYDIGEIRVTQNILKEEGIARLQKVISLGDGDILALQAKKLLQRYAGDSATKTTPQVQPPAEKSGN